MLENFTLETFAPHLGKNFSLRLDAERLDLKLVEANTLGGAGKNRAPFSLIFRGPKELVLPQRIYSFEEESLGTFEIFIVPIGADETGVRYEAIFT